MGIWQVTPGETVKDQFSAFEDDGLTKRSGLTLAGADFVVTVYRDCVVNGLAVTITEIGSSGEYCLEFTPPDEAVWVVEVHVVFSGDICKSTADATPAPNLSGLVSNMERVLGLLHMNSMVDLQQYDANDQATNWRLRHFNAASNVPATEGGSETAGKLHEYEFEVEYEAPNKPKKLVAKVIQ